MSCTPNFQQYPQNQQYPQYPQYPQYQQQNVRQTIFGAGPCSECEVILHIEPPNQDNNTNNRGWYYSSGILQMNGNGLSIVASGLGNAQHNTTGIPACVAGGMSGCPNTFTATFLITSAAYNQISPVRPDTGDNTHPESGGIGEKVDATRVQYCGVIKFTICGTTICGQLVGNHVTRYSEPNHTSHSHTHYNTQVHAKVNIIGAVNYCSGIRSISFSSLKIHIKNN